MKVVSKKRGDLKPYENNPRVTDAAIDAVAESIKQFGFRQPIVIDADDVIVCGHTRYLAAERLELDRVPVHVVTDLSDEQIKAYRLVDNRTSELAGWDFDLLKLELADLKQMDFDLSDLGWSEGELSALLTNGSVIPADAKGKEYDESITEHVEMIECPSCGHKFAK